MCRGRRICYRNSGKHGNEKRPGNPGAFWIKPQALRRLNANPPLNAASIASNHHVPLSRALHPPELPEATLIGFAADTLSV
jgi:hypothetical protein